MDMSLSKLRELVMDREAWVCCSPLGCKEMDMTEWLNWLELSLFFFFFLYGVKELSNFVLFIYLCIEM